MKNIPSIRVIKESRLDAVIHTKTKREAIMLVKILGVDEERFYDENDFIECWDGHKENTCYRIRNGKVDQMDCVKFYQKINEEIYEFPDLFANGGVVSIHDLQTDALSDWATNVQLDKETVFNGLSQVLKRATKVYSSTKEEKKMPTKFTFYVKEGTRVDKTCNKLIPTMTTFITAESYGDSTYHGAATCDKADYDERQGCLEALANAMLGGNFDRDFNRAVKANEFADKKKRTCTYCGQLFDTVEEKQAHEAWHVERKKARRERYLLRKRAKEIAFEEQAQKMAKEMMGEQK